MRTKITHFFLALAFILLLANFTPSDKSFFKLFEKKDFGKIKEQFEKRIEKVPTDPIAFYWKSRYFFDSANTAFNIEEANKNIFIAIEFYPSSDEKIRKKIAQSLVKLADIEELHRQINVAAFHYAKKINKEKQYEHFVAHYKNHDFAPEAIQLMHKAAYAEASKSNKWQNYRAFYEKYPQAAQVEQAKANYEILLFQEKTKDGSVKSYTAFLKENPKTPYRKIIENKIFDMAIIVPDENTFKDFIKNYPTNPNVAKAWDWLFYLHPDKNSLEKNYPNFPDKKKLTLALAAQNAKFYPFVEKEKIGFMDEKGNIRIKAYLDSIPEDYKCEYWQDDLMPIPSRDGKLGLLAKTGEMLFDTKFDEVEDLTSATVKLGMNEKYAIFHKNGDTLCDFMYQDILAVGESFAAVKENEKWKFITLVGKEIETPLFDEIQVFNKVLAKATTDGKSQFFTLEDLQNFALKKKKYSKSSTFIDDITAINDAHFLLTSGNKFGILSKSGKLIHAPNAEKYMANANFIAVLENQNWIFYNHESTAVASEKYSDVKFLGKNIFVRFNQFYGLFNPERENACQCTWDTVALVKNGFWYIEGGQKKLITEDGNAYNLSEYLSFDTKRIENQIFVLVENKKKFKNTLSSKSVLLLKNWYEEVEPMSDGLFRFRQNKKFGLVNESGKVIVPALYTGLVELQKGYYSVLLKKKFGLVAPDKKIDIKPIYDASLAVLAHSADIFIAKKGKFGLINAQSKTIFPFVYERVQAWNKENVLLLQDAKWKIVALSNPAQITETFEDFRPLKTKNEEQLIITYNPTGFGLLSNQKGRLMTDEYSDILNLGDYDEPFYFAEKYLQQAGIYVILYFDFNGKIVKKQTINEAEYVKVACED